MKKILISFIWIVCLATTIFAQGSAEHIDKGNALAQEKKFAEAIQEYQQALSLAPNNSRTNLLLGLTYANAGDLKNALIHMKKCVELDPSYSSYFHLGLICAVKNEPKKALEAFDSALTFNPESSEAHYQKGLVFTSQKKNKKAIEAYQQAVKLNPNFEQARLALAGLAQKEGDKEMALQQVEELRKMKRDNLAAALEQWIANGQTSAVKG